MGYTSYDFFYGDGFTNLLIIVGFLIIIIAEIGVRGTYKKYKGVRTSNGMDGLDTAKKILDANGLDIYVVKTPGELTDHYDSKGKVIRLSDDIYGKATIASVAVAAHECGHALQDKDDYIFLRIRTLLVPVVNLVNHFGYFLLLFCLIGGYFTYITVAIGIVFATLVFHIITLPVEFNASRRGLEQIEKLGILSSREMSGAKSMLRAAAFTYVAGALSSLLQLIRLLAIFNRDRD